jgi:hypothetical protein
MSSPSNPTPTRSAREWGITAVALVVIVAQVVFAIGPVSGDQVDFCVYRAGVVLGWSGVWPYDLSRVQAAVATDLRVPAAELPVGFFLSPVSMFVLSPWGLFPWSSARALWVAALLAAGVACAAFAWTCDRPVGRAGRWWGLVAAAILLNPLVQRAISLGQTGLFCCGCVALGQLAFERRRPVLGAALWAVTAIKPQFAIPLLVVAGYDGGRRRVFAVAAAMAVGWTLG